MGLVMKKPVTATEVLRAQKLLRDAFQRLGNLPIVLSVLEEQRQDEMMMAIRDVARGHGGNSEEKER